MICPFCDKEDQTSRVTPGLTLSTLMASSPGYYDERGTWVSGSDPNWHTTEYACSRGHRFTVRRRAGDPDEVTLVSTLTTASDEP